MQCATCGNRLTPGSTYCPVCGAPAAAPTAPAGKPPGPQQDTGSTVQPESASAGKQPFRARTAFYGRYGARGNAALPEPSSLTLPNSRPPGDEASSAPTLTSVAVSAAASAVPQPIAAPVLRAAPSAQLTAITLPLKPGHRHPLAGRLVALGGVLLLLALLVGLSAFGYNAYGLILRADPNTPADKYVFFVSPAGTYNFARHDAFGFENNGWTDLTAAPWSSSSAIRTGKGATNTLTVIASDNTFTLFINGQQVEVVTDANASYQSGWIGVMVEGADMEAGFSSLQVYGPGA